MVSQPSITFDHWIKLVFDHPVAPREWHWSDDAEIWNLQLSSLEHVDFLTRVFRNPERLYPQFSPDQIGVGLDFLINPCFGCYACDIDASANVPLAERLVCVRSILSLYQNCFVPLLPNEYDPVESRRPDAPRLDSVCYMFWEVAPLAPFSKHEDPRQPVEEYQLIEDACLGVMAKAMSIRHSACQEGALLGLSLWAHHYPTRVKAVLVEYLKVPDLLPELERNARMVIRGCSPK